MIGVQIIGAQNLLAAFDRFGGCDVWGLYQGKQPIVFGQGSDALAEWLQMIERSGTTATYTLRVYDGDVVPNSATGNTGYIASINFKLIDAYEGQGIAGHSTKLVQRLEVLEKRLAGADQDDEPEENLQSIIMGWLKNPEQLGVVIGAVKQLIGAGSGAIAARIPNTAVSETQAIGSVAPADDLESRMHRVAAVLDGLEKHDPKLLEHLEKLLELATESPLIFKGVIAKLDAL